ncbi:MAG TPA: CHAD domain-containing protein [Luteitalea sp.]|nr:CHAD domain-containing protein [Luteitalea sp.]
MPEADLAAVIASRHEALRTHLLPAREGDEVGVHQARVASRRLREVIPVLATGLDELRLKPVRRRLRDVTRALGPVRELDVALGMIDDHVRDSDAGKELRGAWRALVLGKRRAPVRALRKALGAADRATLHRQLDEVENARAASVDLQWRDALAASLTTRARSLRAHIEQTGALFHAEPLHDVRIAAKKLRYALEITADTGLARLARPLATLKKAQDVLGQLHDLDVLGALLAALPDAAAGESLHEEAASVAAALDHEARLLHARYLRTRPTLVRITDFTLDELVVTVRPSSRRRQSSRKGTRRGR